MHHIETFTNSIKCFQALFLEVFLHYNFPSTECTFCRTSQGYSFSHSPLNLPSPKYSSSFSLVISFPFLLNLLRLLVSASHVWAAQAAKECLFFFFSPVTRKVKEQVKSLEQSSISVDFFQVSIDKATLPLHLPSRSIYLHIGRKKGPLKSSGLSF